MAQTYIWKGNSGLYTDSTQWTPAGSPNTGDTAVASSGTLVLVGLSLFDETIDLQPAADQYVTLEIVNTSFDSATSLNADSFNSNGAGYSDIRIQGALVSFGTITVGVAGSSGYFYLEIDPYLDMGANEFIMTAQCL